VQRSRGRLVGFVAGTLLLVAATAIGAPGATGEAGPVGGRVGASAASPPDAPRDAATTFQVNARHDGHAFGALAPPLASVWSVTTEGQVGYPLIVHGRVFIVNEQPSGNGTFLRAVDAVDGSLLWGPTALSARGRPNGIAADGANVYSVNSEGIVRAFDQATGAMVWSRALLGQTSFNSPPTVRDGLLFVGGHGVNGTLYAVSTASGQEWWTKPTAGGGHSSPVVTDDGVYVSYSCDAVYRFAPLDGTLLWARPKACSGGTGKTPVLHDGRLYARNQTYGGVLDAATGSKLRPLETWWIPAFGDELGYQVVDGVLSAFDPASGAVQWTHAERDTLSTAPLVVGDSVAVGSTDGHVYLFDAATGVERWAGVVGAPVSGPDESNARILAGMAAAEGLLLVPAGTKVVAFRDARTPTTTSVAVDPDPPMWDEPVAVSATVAPPGATGSVSFFISDDAQPVAGCDGVALDGSSVATCELGVLAPGAHEVHARYDGDATHATSTGSRSAYVRGVAGEGSIAGTVADTDGQSVHVFVVDRATRAVVADGPVEADGSYLVDGLPDGDVVVFFGASSPHGGPSTRSDEVWPDRHDLAAATAITIEGMPVAGIDADLEPVGTIIGLVTADGADLSGAVVEAVASSGIATQEATRFAVTGPTGEYSFPGLDVGSWLLSVDRDADGLVDLTVPEELDLAVRAGASTSAPTFSVPLPTGIPSQPTSLTASVEAGATSLDLGLPVAVGGAPLDGIGVLDWPQGAEASSEGSTGVRLTGLINGVDHRIAVWWHNAAGFGPGRAVDVVPTGCPLLWFTDVPADSPFCDAIRWLVTEGLGAGYPDGTFRPLAGVTRQAMAAFLYRAAGHPNGADPSCTAAAFDDVPVSHPFCGEISWLLEQGIAAGYPDGTFRGGSLVSRQAMAAFLARRAGLVALAPCATHPFADVSAASPFCDEISWLVDAGIADGYADGTFQPSRPVSRQAMASFLRRADLPEPAPGATPPAPPSWSTSVDPPRPSAVLVPFG